MTTSNVTFESRQLNGLTYWVCLCDTKIVATAWSLIGVRSQVLQLLRHKNWGVQ